MSRGMPSGPFWLVWNPHGRAPQVRHPNEASATAEAERLARSNPGQTFVVLASIEAIKLHDLLRVDLRPIDEPF